MVLNPWLWFLIFLAGLGAFPLYCCSRIAIRIAPGEVPELPRKEFLRARRYYTRSYLAEALLIALVLCYVPSDTSHFVLQNLFIAGGIILLIYSLIHRFRAGKILKEHGLGFFHFDALIGKKAMQGIR